MKKLFLLVVLLASIFPATVYSQNQPFPGSNVIHGVGAPNNPCPAGAIYTNDSNGNLYTCNSGSWVVSGNSNVLHGSVSPTNPCPAGYLYTNDTNGTLYACNSGVWVPANSSKINNPTVAGNLSNNSYPWNLGGDIIFPGPTPYIDLRSYGVRSLSLTTTPAAVGLTATCVATNANVTISSASTFVNGDGVVLYNCGSATSLTAPASVTTTPSIAIAGIQTGFVANAVAGATNYSYEVIAVDNAGGYTTSSAAAATSTGAATLGYNDVAISSCTRSNDIVTCTTSSPHGFNPGCNVTNCGQVYISGVIDANTVGSSFNGWWAVSSAADSTHFTWQGNADTRLGAVLSGAGGSADARWWNCNHISWTAVSGAWIYFIYGRTGGSFNLIGVTRPQSSVGGGVVDPTWDDFGATMEGNTAFPAYIPTTAPGSAGNEYWVTTISSGAGTTTLTLASAPSSSASGTTIRFDNTPNFKAAATAVQTMGYQAAQSPCLFFPVDASANNVNGYAFNSFLDLSALQPVCISQAGSIGISDTWKLPKGTKWYGDKVPSRGAFTSFSFQGNPTVYTTTNVPMVYLDNNAMSSSTFEGISFTSGINNGAQLFVGDGGFNFGFDNVAFQTSSSTEDFVGMGLILRNILPAAGVGDDNSFGQFHRIFLNTGSSLNGSGGDGSSNAPLFFCNGCGQTKIYDLFMDGRGMFYRGDSRQSNVSALSIDNEYTQGSISPLFTISQTYGDISVGAINADSVPHPLITVLPSNGYADTPTVTFANILGSQNQQPISENATGFGVTGLKAQVTGLPFINSDSVQSLVKGSIVRDGLLFPNGGGSYSASLNNAAIAEGAVYPIFISNAPIAAPTCVINSGGSLTVENWYFAIAPVWANGGEGVYSYPSAACVPTSGNQSITINWTAQPGFPVSYNLYYGLGANPGAGTLCQKGITALTYTLASNATCINGSPSVVPTGGPTMMMPGIQGIATPAISTASVSLRSGAFTDTFISATLAANRSITFPDPLAAAVSPLITGSITSGDPACASGTAGIYIDCNNGPITAATISTNPNCSAVGTSASPSIASCGSAAAGHFSCATAATGATCTVNTTAVTGNSEIFVFESDTSTTGAGLGVTCNTSTDVLPTSLLLASSIAATSFTINLGTVTTHPACFSYLIIN